MVPFSDVIHYPSPPFQGDKPLLRDRLQDGLRDARNLDDERAESVINLILTALKERDTCARQSGRGEAIGDENIRHMLADMVEQRRLDMVKSEQSGRLDRVEQERQEIDIIEQFLPRKLSIDEVTGAVDGVIRDVGARGLKDAGKVMASLKERFGSTINAASAKRIVCNRLR